jgi:hypothetical protein
MIERDFGLRFRMWLLIILVGVLALSFRGSSTAWATNLDGELTPSADMAFAKSNLTILAPSADFAGHPTTGGAPLQVKFTEQSSNDPTDWVWYFGDEELKESWAQMTPEGGWAGREGHTVVALPDGSLVLMGGYNNNEFLNDVWRSTDQGATWQQMTESAGWTERWGHSSVALRDGSIILMGGLGYFATIEGNDVWRSTDQGATWTLMTANAKWSPRLWQTSVALPDNSIVLMGGSGADISGDVWRSTDLGATWTMMTASAEWQARTMHDSAVLSDGSIVLIGGMGSPDNDVYRNDVWRSTDQGATWTLMTDNAGWSTRALHSSVALPDGSLVFMGGADDTFMSDVWRSLDYGANWTLVTSNATWSARFGHATATLLDGSIVLTGGHNGSSYQSDVWRLETAGSRVQHPSHTYIKPGTYAVTLQAYNATGYDSLRKEAYIHVTDTVTYCIYLPLSLKSR